MFKKVVVSFMLILVMAASAVTVYAHDGHGNAEQLARSEQAEMLRINGSERIEMMSRIVTGYCETCWEVCILDGTLGRFCQVSGCNQAVYRYKCSVAGYNHFGTVLCNVGHYN
jgi:hypothetical protein